MQKAISKYWPVFVLPTLLAFIIGFIWPFIWGTYLSFQRFTTVSKTTFVGIQNYISVFQDSTFLHAFGFTAAFTVVSTVLINVCAFAIALVLTRGIKGTNLFRTVYYIPSILGGSVAIAVLWKAVFSVDGLLNTVVRAVTFGAVQGPEWLSDPHYALWIICFLRIWQFGSAMVLFLAALKGVPADLYEAATIDGAGKWRQFFSITVPMITPIIFYNLVTQICQAFQEFNGPYIITNGGPRGSTTLISLLVYNYAFKSYDMGMASALAWIMFIIVCVLTIIAFTSQKKWVYYSDER